MQETQETQVFIPGSGRFPGERDGNPHQYSWLENSMDRGAWGAIVHRITKSQTRLSDWAHTRSNLVGNNFKVKEKLQEQHKNLLYSLHLETFKFQQLSFWYLLYHKDPGSPPATSSHKPLNSFGIEQFLSLPLIFISLTTFRSQISYFVDCPSISVFQMFPDGQIMQFLTIVW